jgi:hypothetical protein
MFSVYHNVTYQYGFASKYPLSCKAITGYINTDSSLTLRSSLGLVAYSNFHLTLWVMLTLTLPLLISVILQYQLTF